MPDAIEEITSELLREFRKTGQLNQQNCINMCQKIAHKYKLDKAPALSQLIPYLPPSAKRFLMKKPIRSAAGVQVIAVMCKPHRCPHTVRTGANCTYCGGGSDSDFNYSSQSYTGYEPTSMRAIRARYDPVEQTKVRLNQLRELGHDSGKYEVVLMGGTFMSLDQKYREQFIQGIYQGITGHIGRNLSEMIQFGARSNQKLVALTIETRPDYCEPRHLAQMLRYGTTRIEVGVQSVFSDVIAAINRGHTVRSVVRCFGQARDSGFKLIAHMMPNLVYTSVQRDLWGFRELFESHKFRPDGLKIYPTLVIRGTMLYEAWRQGKYCKHYPHETLINLLADIWAMIPPFVRVYRVMRDIPLPLVTSGVEAANLREMALEELNRRGQRSYEIRQREVGAAKAITAEMKRKAHLDVVMNYTHRLEVVRRDYMAGGGLETFLSIERPCGEQCAVTSTENIPGDQLVGLLRLRKMPRGRRAGGSIRPELQGAVSLIREVHVYGTAVGINERANDDQHRGVGRLLLEAAERIAREEHKSKKICVISGVGTREYYAKFGYALDGVYMGKLL